MPRTPPGPMMLLELSNITIVKGGLKLVSDLNLTVKGGSIVCIRGRNGVGKTSPSQGCRFH
ncbi:MAG: hypothetical protein ACO2O2_06285 [Acidilobaceae archaeon]